MKLKKYLISFITIIAFLFVDVVSAATNAPSSFVVNGKDTWSIDGSEYLNGHSISLGYKQTSDGYPVYCLDIDKASVAGDSVVTFNLVKELDTKYAYVLANGYPNKSITGDNTKDYYITALAIWYLEVPEHVTFGYFDFEKGTYRGVENEVAKEVGKLIKGANNYSYTKPAVEVNISNDNLTLSSDSKYYISSNIGVTTTGTVGNYKVSLENAPSGTIVTDTNGNKKTEFKTNEKFIVKVPVSSIETLNSEFKVNISATGSIYKAYSYSSGIYHYQDVTALYPETETVKTSTTLKINFTTEVQVSKIDVTTEKELPGATLTIRDSSGNVVETWVSTNEIHIVKGLKPGKYTLTEEIAPDGYVLSTETVTFEIKADGSVTKVTMKNAPEEDKPIYISKKDITTGEELAGAHLEIRDEDGNLIEAWVSTTEPHIIDERLEAGKYYLTETLAPIGYELSTETVEFIVNEDGTVDGDVIMYNEPETVDVPNTASFKTITSSLIGIIIIGLGYMIIYKNYKKNEEY